MRESREEKTRLLKKAGPVERALATVTTHGSLPHKVEDKKKSMKRSRAGSEKKRRVERRGEAARRWPSPMAPG
jgi:hypothetical protein